MNYLFYLVAQFNSNALPHVDASGDKLKTILQIVFSIVGVIALVVITLSGFRYVLSGGDPQSTARAKDAILYAVIGLVISISALAIVTFVIGKL